MIDHYEFTMHLIVSSFEINKLDEPSRDQLINILLETKEDDMDALILVNFELIRMLKKKEVIDRIEKGAQLIENTTDETNLKKYVALYEALHVELLRITEVEQC